MAQDTSLFKTTAVAAPGAAAVILSLGAPSTGQFLVEVEVAIGGTSAVADFANMQMSGIAGVIGGNLILPVVPGAQAYKIRFIKTLGTGIGPTVVAIGAATAGTIYVCTIRFTPIIEGEYPDSIIP